jgi:large subunit ribosomal protein L15
MLPWKPWKHLLNSKEGKSDMLKVKSSSKKRVGRGYGSGKGGHTSGRGQKGQKARGSLGVLFEGVKVRKSLLHRLPFQRGKAKFKANPKPLIVNLEALNILRSGTEVTIESLAKAGIVQLTDAKTYGVKILGDGKLEKSLSVLLPTSKSAAAKIVKAGGKVKQVSLS